jgi:hypothetical protein
MGSIATSLRIVERVNEKDLLALWSTARLHIILSQLAPTFLLAVTVTAISFEGGLPGSVAVRLAAAGVLLAAGILGAVAQYTSADEASAVATDLRAIASPSAVTARIIATSRWTTIVKYVTPAIFVLIYLAILWSMFVSPLGH